MTKEEVVASLSFIENEANPDREIEKHITKLKRFFGNDDFLDLLFWSEQELTVDEVVKRMLASKK